jgi:hypothetical protein
MQWTATATSTFAPLCVVYFYIGTDAGGYSELSTYPTRTGPGDIPKAALPNSYAAYTGTYLAGAGDEDDIIAVEFDCDDPFNVGVGHNLGLILFDTFRLAPVVI